MDAPIEIRPIAVPADPEGDHQDAVLFRAAYALTERSSDARYGAGVQGMSLNEFHTRLRGSQSERITVLGAWHDGTLIGVVTLYLPVAESTSVLDSTLEAEPGLPLAVHAALARTVVAELHRIAHDEGRTVIIAGSPGGASGVVTAATGFGGADPHDPEAAPLVERGYVLEQVYRVSVAELDPSATPSGEPEAASDYDLVAWTGRTPGQYREGIRALLESMSTDAPVGGLALDAEVWDEERLREFEDRAEAGDRIAVTIAAVHSPSGALAGYSTMFVLADNPTAKQHNTIVGAPHRGHALGMRLKRAGLDRVRAEFPHVRRVTTWNAEENRPMLRVNEAAGFRPIAYEAVWQFAPSAEEGTP